uniref:SLAIN motif family member 1 n=1 Tax=Oreochromis niloticus TaxID=8128 RepID=I3K728_ORENI
MSSKDSRSETTSDALTPLQWCRQALDSPKSEVEAARRSLSLRLEQVSRWRSSLSSPSPSSSPGPPLSRVAGVSPISASPPTKPCSTPRPSERHGCSLRHSTLSPQSSMDSDLGASEAEDDSIALGYKLQDLTDVQVMARLQEENLRAHRYFSFINPRRSKAGLRQHLVRPGQPPQPELDLPAQPAQRRSRPGGGRRGGRRRLRSPATATAAPHPPAPLPHFLQHPRLAKKHQFPVHPSFHPLHPPYPSAGFAIQPALQAQSQGLGLGLGLGLGVGSTCAAEQQCFRPGSDKLRRSMPNLVRAPSMPSVPIPANPSASPSLLRNSQSFDSSSGLARLQSSIPSPGQLQNRVQSVGNFTSLSRPPLKATAYVSPTIKGSASMPTSISLQSLNLNGSGGGGGGANSGIPLLSKPAGTPTASNTARSSLPRPASFVGTTSSSPAARWPNQHEVY